MDRHTGDHVDDEMCVYTRLFVRACIMSQRSQTWTRMIWKPTVSAPEREVEKSALSANYVPRCSGMPSASWWTSSPEARQWNLFVSATRWTGWEMFKEGLKDQCWFHHSLYHSTAGPHTLEVLQHGRRACTSHTRHQRSSSLMVPSIGPWLASDCRLKTKLMRGWSDGYMHLRVRWQWGLMHFSRRDKCVNRCGDYVLNISVHGFCMCVYVNEICS